MSKEKACLLWIGMLALPSCALLAQSPDQVIQQVAAAERTANHNDHSQWIYLEEVRKPKEHIVQWVAGTSNGDVRRIVEKDGQPLPGLRQHELIDNFLRDTRAQNKQVAETNHDNQQIDDLLKLLPSAFLWTETGATATTTSLHFEPAAKFHPPTREARVFSAMAGDLVTDNQQHRVVSMTGHLIHDVTFGGGILGKLREGSSFSLAQQQCAPGLWQLTAIHVHLRGNALLFKSISLEEDDARSRFEPEPPAIALDEAARLIMMKGSVADVQKSAALK